MNAEERVMKAVNHEEPDKVPAFETTITNKALANYYEVTFGTSTREIYASLAKMGKKGNELLKKGYENLDLIKRVMRPLYEFYRKVKLDITLSISSNYPRIITDKGEGFIDEYGRKFKYESYIDKEGNETIIGGYQGGHLKNFEDYESWEQPNPNWKARYLNFRGGKEVQCEMKNTVFSIPSVGALMECSWESFGLEVFSKILAKPKQAKRVFDDRGKFTLEVVKRLAEEDAKIVLLWDDYGYKNGLFMSPRMYRKYVFPWIKRICDAAHKLDCKVMLHSDGDLIEIFEDIINCGIDILNPIEPTTANPEYDIFKLNEKYGDQLTFCGNLSPVMLARGEISEIERYAKRLIRELAPGGGYIYSSGHSINPAVTVDRWLKMVNVKEKYGLYPIGII